MPQDLSPNVIQRRSVYVPDYALQGQEFSGHVIWEESAELVSLSITLPEGLAARHIYNVPKEAIRAERDGQLVIRGVQQNGYVGFVFESKRFAKPDVAVEVRIAAEIVSGGVARLDDQTFGVRLFRPSLWVEDTKRSLEAENRPGDVCLRVRDPLHLSNQGRGTALVLVKPRGLDPDQATDYLLQDDVRKTYMRVITEGFSGIEADFADSRPYLDLWRTLFESVPGRVDEALLEKLEKIQEDSKTIERDSPELLERIGEVLADALLAIFTLDQRFKALAQGMNATLERGVVVLNPSTAVKLSKGESVIDFELTYFDVLFHAYPMIPLGGVRIHSAGEGILPLFELFTTKPLDDSEVAPSTALPRAR